MDLGLGPAPSLVLGAPFGYGIVMVSGVDHREITGSQYLVLFSGGPHLEVLSGSVPLGSVLSAHAWQGWGPTSDALPLRQATKPLHLSLIKPILVVLGGSGAAYRVPDSNPKNTGQL